MHVPASLCVPVHKEGLDLRRIGRWCCWGSGSCSIIFHIKLGRLSTLRTILNTIIAWRSGLINISLTLVPFFLNINQNQLYCIAAGMNACQTGLWPWTGCYNDGKMKEPGPFPGCPVRGCKPVKWRDNGDQVCCGCLRHFWVSLRAPLSEKEGTLPLPLSVMSHHPSTSSTSCTRL